MVNFNIVDGVQENINKSYINLQYSKLYTNDIEYYKYIVPAVKYNKDINNYDIYIMMSNKLVGNYKWRGTYKRNKIYKIDLIDVARYLPQENNNIIFVNIVIVDIDDDGAIYKIDF